MALCLVKHRDNFTFTFTLYGFWEFHGGDVSVRAVLCCDAYCVVVGYQHFGGPCSLHLQGEVYM
jgi:hypothetical protein